MNHKISSKNFNVDNNNNNSNDKFFLQNKMIRVVNSRQFNNQVQKQFGYSTTENYFNGQKFLFNSNYINNIKNNGIYFT